MLLVKGNVKFYIHGSVHSKSILINVLLDATTYSLYFILLQDNYMFRVPATPIIRST